MQGRIFKIKKTTILSFSFYLAILSFIVASVLTIVLLKNYYVWFFFFCLFAGLHLLLKSVLFYLDSCFYFGSLLFLIGAFGLLTHFLNLLYFQSVYYILAFAFSSYFTFCFFNQKFHLIAGVCPFLIDIAWFFYKINMITVWIFIAFVLALVLLFVVKYLLKNYLRRG